VTFDDASQILSNAPGVAIAIRPENAAPAAAVSLPASPQAVFLHTFWRSGGTWIWSRCRDANSVCGFYEPLHEQAATFSRASLNRLRPANWRSSHSETAPYFEEFRPLIPDRGRGVHAYRERFAFDGFFLSPEAPADPALEAYLHALIAHAAARGRMPVLKFCRSAGRAGWMQARFPNVAHFIVLRDPVSQYLSIRGLLENQRNRYFAVAPLLVLARNAQLSCVRKAASAFGVNLPALHSPDLAYQVEICWRQVRHMADAERYRAFLAFWTLGAGFALHSSARVIDMPALGADTAYRESVEADLRRATGAPIDLSSWRPAPALPRTGIDGLPEAHAAAMHFLANHFRLEPSRMAVLTAKLEIAGGLPRRAIYLPQRVAPPPWPAAWQGVATAAAILTARAMQPLRRLHGAMAWHLPPAWTTRPAKKKAISLF
jgi:hypothetical protein